MEDDEQVRALKKPVDVTAHARLPHYALPNFSTVLPTYTNYEADAVVSAFRVGNFYSIKDLPENLRPGQVARQRFQKILENQQQAENCDTYQPKRMCFSEFEYIPSPYSIVETMAREERLAHEKKVSEFGGGSEWRPTGACHTSKHEDFGKTGEYNVHANGPEPYEAAEDQALRQKWLMDAAILSGPFRPAGRVKGHGGQAANEIPSARQLPEIVEQLHLQLVADWSDYPFVVCSTEDEHIVVRFELSVLETAPGLQPYMNAFARGNFVVTKYMLKKVVEDWNVTPGDGMLYFTLRPPWIKSLLTDTFYTLHPEQRQFQDTQSKIRAARALPDGREQAKAIEPEPDLRMGTGHTERPHMA
jgi:hypothetical protein